MESDTILHHIDRKNNNMKINIAIHKTLILSFLICFSLNVYSQKLIESRQTSYYTYIYKITDKEAKKIYKNDIWKVDTTFFHTLVDSFPTDSPPTYILPVGHYIKTFAEKNRQKVFITTIQDFDVHIMNNNTDLCIQVYDLNGNIIPDAKLKVRWKNLHYNRHTKSYIDKKSNQKGLLEVTYKGFTAYYNLSRQCNNSNIKRGARKVVYGTPIKYAWLPIDFVVYLPIDVVRSIVKGWPQGTINRTVNFFVKAFHNVACLFDDYYCDYYSNNKFERKHTGYIVFNKPKYLPQDTVKIKAFILTKKGKPINKPVKLVLHANRKNIMLTELEPYSKGGYEYQFYLHDSLQLQLDRSYDVSLELNNRKKFINGYFKYEDYELTKNNLTLRLDEPVQYRNKKFLLYVKGTDENELNLLDARIDVLVKPKSINKYFEKKIFVPDTILFIEKRLEPTEETEILIPDSVFPPINFEYEIEVKLFTSDNEVVTKSEKVKYYYNLSEFDIELLADSIQFKYIENGISKKKNTTVYAVDNFGNETILHTGDTPFQLELSPYYSSYSITSDSLQETIDISSEPSLLQCQSQRTTDSIFIVVDNPRKIPFSYNIYKKNRQKSVGIPIH